MTTQSIRSDPAVMAQRRITESLIRLYPSMIALVRPAKLVKSGAGGRVREGSDVPQAPKARFFSDIQEPLRFALGDFRVNESGQVVRSIHILIGTYDDDIKEDDYFDLEGGRYHVKFVHDRRTYETRCQVVRYAS